MSHETVAGFQPGLAGTLDMVVPTMQATHDALILRTGRARTSGIHWQIFGTELAGVLARTRGGGSPYEPAVAGTLEDGLEWLASLHQDAFGVPGEPVAALAAALKSDTVHPEIVDEGGTVARFRSMADRLPTPTLVIAYCQVRIRTVRHR